MNRQYVKIAVASCLIMSAMIVGTMCFGFFMEPVTTALSLDRSTFSLYFSLITIVGLITLPIYGRLIERYGARPFVVFGGLWTGLTMAALSMCHDLMAFYVVGCLIGLGFFGCSYAAVPVIVSAWFVKKNGMIMGLTAACGGTIGMLLSLVFPSFIIGNGWEAGYVLLGAIVLVLTVPAGVLLLRSWPSDVGMKPYGFNEEDAIEDSESVMSGVPYKKALRMPQLWVMILAFVLLMMTIMITQHLAAYFVSVGFDAVMAGVFLSVMSAGIIVTNMLSGVITDKIGLKKALIICSVLYCASFVLLPLSGSIVFISIALFFMSIGNANCSVFAPIVTQAVFGRLDYASIWGLASMANVLGQALGTPLWGLAFDLTGSYAVAMYTSAVIVVAALLALLWVTRLATPRPE